MKITGKIFISYIIIILIINVVLFTMTDLFNNNKNSSICDQIIDGVYFTTSTISSVGYGDITPKKPLSKIIISMEQIMLIYFSFDIFSQYIAELINNK